MSQLGTMMLRAGLLSEAQVAQAQARSTDRQIPLVESILELGLSDEDAVCTFFHSKLTIPRVSASVLDRIEDEPLRSISPAVAWRHAVLPVSVDDVGNVTLAMVDPTDMRAVDAIARATGGGYLIRAVAALGPLRRALEQHYGPRPPPAVDAAATHPGMDIAAVSGEQAAEAPQSSHFAAPDRERALTPSNWNPPLLGVENEPAPLSSEAFGRLLPRLVAAADRDEVTRAVLDFLAAGFQRVILFTHIKGELAGREARGRDLMLEAVRQVRIPSVQDSVFARVIENRAPFFGPMPRDSAIDMAFAQALGGIDGNVLVLPVLIGDKVPLLVFASGTGHPVDPRSLRELTASASHALQRIIAKRRARA